MKQLFFILTVLFFSICSVFAQRVYEVNNKQGAIMRPMPGMGSPIVTIKRGVELTAVGSTENYMGNFIQIKYNERYGFVSEDDLLYLRGEAPVITNASSSSSLEISSWKDLLVKLFGNTQWAWAIIIPAGICLFVVQSWIQNDTDGKYIDKAMVHLTWLAAIVSIFEIVCQLGSQDFTNFLSGGWLSKIIMFLLFGAFCYFQFLSFTMFTSYYSNGIFHFGVLSWPLVYVIAILGSFINLSEVYVIGFLVIAQLIQVGIVFYFMFKYSNLIYAILVTCVYLLFSIATGIIFINFMNILVMVLLVIFLLGAFTNGSRGSSSSGNGSTSGTINPYTGETMTYIGGGMWKDPSGREYWKDGNIFRPK